MCRQKSEKWQVGRQRGLDGTYRRGEEDPEMLRGIAAGLSERIRQLEREASQREEPSFIADASAVPFKNGNGSAHLTSFSAASETEDDAQEEAIFVLEEILEEPLRGESYIPFARRTLSELEGSEEFLADEAIH